MKPTIKNLLKEFTADFARLNEIPKNLANPKYHAYLEGADDFSELLERKLEPELAGENRRLREALQTIAGALRETEDPHTLKKEMVIMLCYDLAESALKNEAALSGEPDRCPDCKGTGKIATGSSRLKWRYCGTCKAAGREWLLKHAEGEDKTMYKSGEPVPRQGLSNLPPEQMTAHSGIAIGIGECGDVAAIGAEIGEPKGFKAPPLRNEHSPSIESVPPSAVSPQDREEK